jgi:hypothetical protein
MRHGAFDPPGHAGDRRLRPADVRAPRRDGPQRRGAGDPAGSSPGAQAGADPEPDQAVRPDAGYPGPPARGHQCPGGSGAVAGARAGPAGDGGLRADPLGGGAVDPPARRDQPARLGPAELPRRGARGAGHPAWGGGDRRDGHPHDSPDRRRGDDRRRPHADRPRRDRRGVGGPPRPPGCPPGGRGDRRAGRRDRPGATPGEGPRHPRPQAPQGGRTDQLVEDEPADPRPPPPGSPARPTDRRCACSCTGRRRSKGKGPRATCSRPQPTA